MTRAQALATVATSTRELWIELMARLWHTRQECSQPDAARRLRALGVRRSPGTVVRHLAREYTQAARMAALCGIELHAQELAQRSRALVLRDDLDHDFHGLAATYQQLLIALAPESGSQLHQWLEGRASVHAAQAEGLVSAPHPRRASTDFREARGPPMAATMQPAPAASTTQAHQSLISTDI